MSIGEIGGVAFLATAFIAVICLLVYYLPGDVT